MIETDNSRKAFRSLVLILAVMAASSLTAALGPSRSGDRRPASDIGAARQARPAPPSAALDQSTGKLSASDKSEIATAMDLKTTLGDKIWPGFDSASIPIVLYDSSFEFLTGAAEPPAPWEKVAGDALGERPYFRRPAADPQSFAVKVDSGWAGSVSTLASMNAKNPIKLTPDLHVVIILHEMFHAFQAMEAPERFAAAQNSYKAESGYPYGDKDFAAAWTAEGAALAGALKAKDDLDAAAFARKFIEARDSRRGKARLEIAQLEFERAIEWLEGMAEYAEIAFYQLAAGRSGLETGILFGARIPWLLQWDFTRLEKQLGSEKGDLRFYVSGMAQAFLLDRLDPNWKALAALDTFTLEDQLRRVVLSPASQAR